MSKEMVLAIINNTVLAQPYAGTRAQSFNIVPQSDGSVGIRNSYDDLAVTISENRIWASPYKGNAWQSFSIRHYEDGSCTLHSKYYPVVLEMTATKPNAFTWSLRVMVRQVFARSVGFSIPTQVPMIYRARWRPLFILPRAKFSLKRPNLVISSLI